jgi:hypothetical protein
MRRWELAPTAAAMLAAAAASTLSVAGLTAWFALVELAKIRAGETVVVQDGRRRVIRSPVRRRARRIGHRRVELEEQAPAKRKL